MESQRVPSQKSKIWGYVAFLICGICVALNLLAYLPSQTFGEAEATEFTVTLLLLLVFVSAGLIAAILTIKNRRDVSLVSLLLLTIAFVIASNNSGSWEWKMRTALQLSYAILALTLGTVGLLASQRRAS